MISPARQLTRTRQRYEKLQNQRESAGSLRQPPGESDDRGPQGSCVELLASEKRKKHGLSWKSNCTVSIGGFSTLVK
ncbi:MAG: hypothetical protein DMF21_04790 [Verrucomicrobia bacterium]|nr:MAG: hypothetical protein DMF21_04790 [Verrucomicrobiota bacterium]